MNRPYFKFYPLDWLAGEVQALTMEQQGIFINLVARMWKNGGSVPKDPQFLARLLKVEEQALNDCLTLVERMGTIVERDELNYTTKFIAEQIVEAEKARENARSAGRKSAESRGYKTGNDRSTTVQRKGNYSYSYSNSDKKEKYCKKKGGKTTTTKRFKKPTPQEVEAYGEEIDYPIDGARFCDYYEAKDWMIGKNNRMKNWKAAVRTWQRNDNSGGKTDWEGLNA